ncbi:Sodium:solute symporter family protein [Cardinium endosymbiont of Sogatella furcifera]|uniref:sodium:solute symporter family transporter n=1 Tax=Cardinium endosymbiont of Sogatella furcifera TaxID=650378 RepID=UPI000E0CDB74|nr:HD domain-containing protein [Cardinium endosymbiont of Sogatella furcifera]AXI24186.1 Sodium:solute symporter family protein [Cardinium endosymbiont of Sogatella furcifera]
MLLDGCIRWFALPPCLIFSGKSLPCFKGIVAISLLAMAMSTADSELNSCSIMVSHDMLESIRGVKADPYRHQLLLAKLTTLVVGLLAMIVAFCCKDLLKLMFWTLDLDVIVVAPFILIVFGFRGTSRTALLGMATGALAILSWNKWVKSIIEVNGAFICMLINILAMLAAHYLFKQPKGTGWVKPDNDFLQIQQENSRKKAERKERIKNAWINRKDTLVKLIPSHAVLIFIGFYVIISNFMTYCITHIMDHNYWLILQFLVGFCFLGYGTFFSAKIQPIPGWVVGLFFIIGLAFCLPINVLWHWWHRTNLFLTLGLSLTHLLVTLLVLPLYLGVSFLMATLLIATFLSSIYCTNPFVLVLSSSTIALLLLLCLGLGLLIFGIFVYLKAKTQRSYDQITYLKRREELKEARKLKSCLYNASLVPSNSDTSSSSKGYGFILNQVVGKIEESISFLDSNVPLYKQDFQSIINKFYDWITYFNRKERYKNHALLQPTKITFDRLIRKVEVALSQEVDDPPRILVEKINDSNGTLSAYIVCDMNQIVYLLAQAILRVGNLEHASTKIVRIQLHATSLQFAQADPIDNSYPTCMDFLATGLVISHSAASAQYLPKVKEVYYDLIDGMCTRGQQEAPPSIDLQMQTISTIIGAHYGYLEASTDRKQLSILLVLPNDVTAIRDKMTAKLPIDALTSESPVTPKEQADSMMVLMKFHDYVCKTSYQKDAIDIKTISSLLLLLHQHFGFKRHASGQLFYVRSVGIAEYVVEWAFHSPKVIYAALLYELVRYTCLPLSYIKAHYNLGVYAFVLNVVGIDKRQALDHPSLLYVQNRLKEAIKEDHVQLSVLFIKLAERLYDLRHASGYIHLSEVVHMAQETLAIDVQIANTYLGPEIGLALAQAAKQALAEYKRKEKTQHKQKDQDR